MGDVRQGRVRGVAAEGVRRGSSVLLPVGCTVTVCGIAWLPLLNVSVLPACTDPPDAIVVVTVTSLDGAVFN